MNLTVEVDDKNLESFLTLAVKGFEKSAIELENSANQLGEVIGTQIIDAITKRHPIGKFMGPRTKVTVEGNRGTVLIHVGGIPEPKTGVLQYNLWEDQEYGYNTGDIEDTYMAWDNPKGSGENWTHITSRKGQDIIKYVGEVAKVISGMKAEIALTIKTLTMRAAVKQVDAVIRGASGGKIKSKTTFKGLGITPQMNITSVDVIYPSMQIVYHGVGGKFVSPTAMGLPTTAHGMAIKTGHRNVKIRK